MEHYSEWERELLDGWPTVTTEDLDRLNDLFPHYIFFRNGKESVDLRTSCCGHTETRPYLQRTETPEDREFLESLVHKRDLQCPWCGRKMTAIDLSKAKKRKSLGKGENAVLLHSSGEALYADALWLRKDYETDAELTAKPYAAVSSGYRFSMGEVMEVDHQLGTPWQIGYERGKLGRIKHVQEPFKLGCISWYQHQHYVIVNREVLEDHPLFRYCGYFQNWQYRPFGARGYAYYFSDFISYLTAYSIYPRQVEMMGKLEFWQPLWDLIFSRKKNAEAICWEETDIRKSFGLMGSELKSFLSSERSLDVLAVHRYVQNAWGKTWSLKACSDFCGAFNEASMATLRFAKKKKLDSSRFLRYLQMQHEQHLDVECSGLFDLYRDYYNAAYLLGECLEHSRVLYPENLLDAHTEFTERLDTDGIKRRTVSVAENAMTRKAKYEFELDGLRIVFPMTGASIKREGVALKHCVGGYAERHIKGVLTILFLRHADRPGKPYVTIEMDGNQLRQIHGYNNEVGTGAASPKVIHKAFLDTWLSWLKAGSPRDKSGKPRLPRAKKLRQDANIA